jgi:hypothetical protein
VIGLEGGSWNRIGGPVGRIPHDLAHLVVEQELGLARGLWGVLADGGLVQNADATLARQRVHLDGLRRAVGARWWHDDLTVDRFERIDAELRAAALGWDRLAPEAALARTSRAAPAGQAFGMSPRRRRASAGSTSLASPCSRHSNARSPS